MSQFCQKSNMTKNCFNLKDVIAGTALMAVNGCSSNSNLSEAPEESFSSAPQDEIVFVKKTVAETGTTPEMKQMKIDYAIHNLNAFPVFKAENRLEDKNLEIFESHEEFEVMVETKIGLNLTDWQIVFFQRRCWKKLST
eukprot:GHVP01060653.1.p1 GENE.GHVP01060653.1~~GHVP01060653.1.p1  ORF type:complete len:139 (+),score=36.08 GHVP01060653.1:294-710(+)